MKRFVEGVGLWCGVHAGVTDALCNAIRRELGLSFIGGFFDAAVRIEKLFACFDVSDDEEDHGKSGEIECMANVGAATK